MYDRISGSFAFVSQADEPAHSVDSDGFTQTIAGLPCRSVSDPHVSSISAPTRPFSLDPRTPMVKLERFSYAGDELAALQLPDKRGLCVSRPHTSDVNLHSSSSSSPSTSAPARPSTSLFDFRTAELSDANVGNICVGLTTEWLRHLDHSASARMNALLPGSEVHASAAERQQQYQQLKDVLLAGATPSQADLEAQNTILYEAGLAPSGREKKYRFGEPSSFSRMLEKITQDGSNYLLSFYFAEGGAHLAATSASNGMTTLFDPNYGEFTVPSDQMHSLFQSLANRYRNPNGLHLSIVTTQRVY